MLPYQQHYVAECSISVPSVPTSSPPPQPRRCWPHRRPQPGSSSLVKVGKRLHNPQLARHWSRIPVCFCLIPNIFWSENETLNCSLGRRSPRWRGCDDTAARAGGGGLELRKGRVRAGPCRGRLWLISECQLITFTSNLSAGDSWHSIAGVTTFLRYPDITLYTGRICGRSCCCPR